MTWKPEHLSVDVLNVSHVFDILYICNLLVCRQFFNCYMLVLCLKLCYLCLKYELLLLVKKKKVIQALD